MPAELPPSLEDLARAAVEAWDKSDDAALEQALSSLAVHVERNDSPTRVLDYVLPVRTQVELRLACALTTLAWPESNHACQAIVDKARHLARLLLDAR